MQRTMLCLLAGLLALTTLASCLTVAALHDHDYSGEDCVTCHVLGAARQLLRSHAGAVVAKSHVEGLVPLLLVAMAVCSPRCMAETPITLKVKLLD